MWLALLVLVGTLALGSCTPPPPSNSTPTDLHLPHVAKIPGIEALEQRTGIRTLLMTTYRMAAAPRETRVLFHLVGGGVYDVALDGSGLRQIPTQCGNPIAVTPDGRWLVCQNDSGIALHDLLTQGPAGDRQVLADTADLRFGTPSWTPDGHHLATVTNQAGGCAIAIYASNAAYVSFPPSALLAFPEFALPGTSGIDCYVQALAWSGDGQWLSFVGGHGYNVYVLALPVAVQNMLRSPAPPPSPLQMTIESQDLFYAGTTYSVSRPVWSPTPDTLTLASSQGDTISNVNVQTHAEQTLVVQQVADVLTLSWTPDGQHLVFVAQVPNGDYPPFPAEIYVYSPVES